MQGQMCVVVGKSLEGAFLFWKKRIFVWIQKDLEGGISFLLSGGASVLHLISGTRTEVLWMSSVCRDPSEELSTQISGRLHCQVCPRCGWNTQPGSACEAGWGSRS